MEREILVADTDPAARAALRDGARRRGPWLR
jgi:hypothetical protein